MSARRISFVSSAADESLIEELRDRGFEVATQPEDADAYDRLLASPPDLLVLDVAHVSAGIELIRKVRASAEFKKSLVLAMGEWGSGLPTLALSTGADAFERKPFDATALIATIESLLRPNRAMKARASGSDNDDE